MQNTLRDYETVACTDRLHLRGTSLRLRYCRAYAFSAFSPFNENAETDDIQTVDLSSSSRLGITCSQKVLREWYQIWLFSRF